MVIKNPCGTPQFISAAFDNLPLTETTSIVFDKYDIIKVIKVSELLHYNKTHFLKVMGDLQSRMFY